jgi:hypothetical protein
VFICAAQIAGRSHAECGAEGSAGMTGAEAVVGALGSAAKAASPAGLAEVFKKLTAATGEQFMHVALVADVEDKLVLGRGKHAVERDGEFDDTEIWTDVAAVFSGSRDNLIADFLGESRELVGGKSFNVGRAVD